MSEINDTVLLQLLNQSTAQTMAVQDSVESQVIYLIFSAMSGLLVYSFLFAGPFSVFVTWHTRVKRMAKQYMELTGRKLIVMNHAQSGLFGSMITMEDAHKIESLLRKFRGQKIDMIMNTFGGDLFASIRIAHMLANNNNVRVVVPKYAWSGGSMISIGATKILANPTTIFGAVDPQFGNIFKAFSAKYWREIVKKKGAKANDDTIAMSRMGDELMREMRIYLDDIVKGKKLNKKMFYDLMLEGKHTHSNIITPDQMKKMGFDVELLENNLPDRIIEVMGAKSGVYGF